MATHTRTTPAAPALRTQPPPAVTDLSTVQQHSAYQSLEPVTRPPYWGVDLDPARRPGTPMMRPDPKPLPNAHVPIERQAGEPASPKHGRPNKAMPPVFGTSTPLRGISGLVKRLAYQLPDHKPSHWLLLMAGDRVEVLGHRALRYLPALVPIAAVAALVASRRTRSR